MRATKPTESFLQCEHGATIAHFAIVAPVFFLMLFGFFDIARYFAMQRTLDSSVANAGRMLKSMPVIDLDVEGLSRSSFEYANFSAARQMVSDEVSESSRRTTTVAVPGQREEKVHFLIEDQTTPSSESLLDAAILRPGESGQFIFPNGQTEAFQHPLVAPGQQSAFGFPISTEALLKHYPFVIEARAVFQPITPFVGKQTVRSRQFVYHEEISGNRVPRLAQNVETTTTTTITTTSSTTTTTWPCDRKASWGRCAPTGGPGLSQSGQQAYGGENPPSSPVGQTTSIGTRPLLERREVNCPIPEIDTSSDPSLLYCRCAPCSPNLISGGI